MLFTSLDFFLFLPVALAVFAALPGRARLGWLLLASALFYGWNEPSNLLWLAAVAGGAYGCARLIASPASERRRRIGVALGLSGLIGALAVFKFYDFCAQEAEAFAHARGAEWILPRIGVTAPAGFSFYAFSAAAFLIDAYRRQLPLAAGARDTLLYLAWFPKVFAGPIERAGPFIERLRPNISPTPEQIVLGAQLIGWGLVKKVVVADNLAPVVDHAFGIAAFASPVELTIATYFFAFQIYCDFSGYTDIAIGVSSLFGLPLAQNFRRPYLARSPAEFWSSRWHITLANWFRDYVYFPLGGSRAGAARRCLNVMLVFLASGLWHAGLGWGVGWTFLAWGALNGFYVCAGAASAPLWAWFARLAPRAGASRAWGVLRILLTFHLIAITWILFRAKTLHDAWTILTKIAMNVAEFPQLLGSYAFTAPQMLGAALIAALAVIEAVDERKPILDRMAEWPAAARWSASYAAIAALLVLGHWQTREFIYMRF